MLMNPPRARGARGRPAAALTTPPGATNGTVESGLELTLTCAWLSPRIPKPGSSALTVTVTGPGGCAGLHVPSQLPLPTCANRTGRSPLLNSAITEPAVTGLAQSSATCAAIVTACRASTALPPGKDVSNGNRTPAVQSPLAAHPFIMLTPARGAVTRSKLIVCTLSSSNASVNAPRRIAAPRPDALGCTMIDACCPGITVASVGNCRNQVSGGSGERPEKKLTALVARFETTICCDPGSVPAAPVKINPVGRATGGRPLPAGKTSRASETVCGEFIAVGARTSTSP